MEKTNKDLVAALKLAGVLESPHIIEAFTLVNRADFVPEAEKEAAYEDAPLPIAAGQTISQPYTVAFMLELLNPEKGDCVLDVGSGSGWTSALLAYCVGENGFVWGVERKPELVSFGRENVAKYALSHVGIREAGEELGLPEHAPYEKILVSAAAEDFPEELFEQLARGGSMVVPIQNAVWKVEKGTDGSRKGEAHEGFASVPLIAKRKWGKKNETHEG